MMNNIKLLLFSNDVFLSKTLKDEFTNLEIVLNENNNNLNEYSIIVFDGIEKEKIISMLDNFSYENKLVINLSNDKIENIMTLSLPFNVNTLIFQINNFIHYLNNNCFSYKNIILNINKNTLIENFNKIILTEKETEIIRLLFTQKPITKEQLLQNVCGYDNVFETKAIETLVYNIKVKLKNNKIDDFIEYKNGIYQVI